MNVSRKNPLHLSTLLIVAGTAFALLLIVIPGEIDDRYYARDFQQQSHGWPWVHLHRFVPKPNSDGEGREQLQQRLESYRKHGNPLLLIPIPGGRYWTKFENWTFWKGMLAPNWMGCLFNALACTAILLAVGFLVEHRRRKRNSFWQVSLPELLGLFVAVAVIVTLVTESVKQIQREAKARELLVEPQASRFEFIDAAPAWLRKLTDNSRFLQVRVAGTEPVPLGWRVREVQFADQGLGWFKNPAECAKCLESFSYMTTLDHWNSGSDSLKLVADAPAENIRRMSLFPAYSVSDRDYRFLGRFRNLEVLCLRDIDLGKVRFDFPVLPKLVEICIDENRVTPRVLEWLRQQPRLKTVKLWSAFSIDEGRWHEVQSALPGMTIQDRLGDVHP